MNNEVLLEIERETANTVRLVECLHDDHLAFKPHEKSMSLGQLTTHIVELHNWLHQALVNDVFDLNTMYKSVEFTQIQDLKGVLFEGLEKNKAVVNSFSAEQWNTLWTFKAGDHIIATLPKSAAFRFILQNHLIHHRGQLTVYMRLLDLPLPGIYGPSADDK